MAPSTEPRVGRRLSVVIPVLNEAPQIRATLADLQPLRSQGHQLILVDGGSRDGTPDLAKPLVDQLLTAPPGRARQMNAGAALAEGEVLWFLHGDTRIPAGAPRALLAALDQGAVWMAPENSSSFSVSVVLPASGWEMMAKVRRRRVSEARDTESSGKVRSGDGAGRTIGAARAARRCGRGVQRRRRRKESETGSRSACP